MTLHRSIEINESLSFEPGMHDDAALLAMECDYPEVPGPFGHDGWDRIGLDRGDVVRIRDACNEILGER